MPETLVPVKLYLRTWAALMVLLILTIGAAYIPMGPLNTVAALIIAAAKALIIVLFFMHMRWSSGMIHLAAVCGILWLGILISFVVSDYLTRDWIPNERHGVQYLNTNEVTQTRP